jgi:hypothetical protein
LASQPPKAATVTFHHDSLTIEAHNSTLLQILQAITAQTGMKVQGSPGDHRIFGTYGPDHPRAVLSQLLSGFAFNYILVGTAKNGAPKTLILAGTPDAASEPSPPANSIQPAPQNTLPQPQFGPRPTYQPTRPQTPAQLPVPATTPHQLRTPQQILKELEAMHAHQKPSPQ